MKLIDEIFVRYLKVTKTNLTLYEEDLRVYCSNTLHNGKY